MRAIVDEGNQTKLMEMPKPALNSKEVRLKMEVTGLNRRDLYIKDRHESNAPPVILGSDGVGEVEAIGADVTRFKIGDKLIVNPGLYWNEATIASAPDLEIVGFPHHGTFAEYYVQDEDYLEHKPAYLSDTEAAVLSLSALTGYRAIFTKGQLKPGETVLIPGAGGGVSSYMIQFAKAQGARVIVTSRKEAKLRKAKELGADRGILTESEWGSALVNETIDLVIDSIGAKTLTKCLDVLKPGGRLVTFGATTEDSVSFNVRQFFYKQQMIIGSTMGSREELRALLTFIEKHQLRPVVDTVYSLDQYEEAFARLEASTQFGKIAIKL